MPINELYHNWMRRICELRPNQRITQVRNFVWLMIGIYQESFGYFEQDCWGNPWFGKVGEYHQALSRLLDNPAIHVREWYEPIAQQWLEAQWQLSGRDPSDRGWNESWFWTSVTHGQSGVSKTGDPNCLDLGQTCSWSQQCVQAIGLAELCQDTFTCWCSRFSGR